MSFEIPSIASAKTTLLISAASVCLVASTSSVAAQPFIKYQDNNPNPGMFNAGSSFDIDLWLSFGPGDISANSADNMAGGLSFDLEFYEPGSTPSSVTTLTLVGRNNTGSLFDTFNNFNPGFSKDNFWSETGSDLGQTSFVNSAPEGDTFLATYTFAIPTDLPAGIYELGTGGDSIPAMATRPSDFADIPLSPSSYRFQVVPEPTSLTLLAASALIGTRRRSRHH